MSSGNPSYKPSEGKREEFRKYLEKNGVMDALTKVLVNLYEEVDKPEDALEYIRDRLAVLAGLETHKMLQQKITEAEERIKELEGQLETMQNPPVEGEGEIPAEPEGESPEQPVEEQPPIVEPVDEAPAPEVKEEPLEE